MHVASKNKLADLHYLCATSPSKLFFISESWLTADVTDCMLDPDNEYTVFRCDRGIKNGGGVCVLISRDIRCYKLELSQSDLILLQRSECELICCDVISGSTKYRVVMVYRPPSSSFKNVDILHAANKSLC